MNFVFVLIILFSITACIADEDTIKLSEEKTIKQLEKYYIEDTKDYFMITKLTKLDIPDKGDGVTVSFDIIIPYTIHVNGTDYNGKYILGNHNYQSDDNKKYDIKITNISNDYKAKVIITKKN